MKILIIEDEIKTSRALARLIESIIPDVLILETLQSVEETIIWLNQKVHVDLIFMDIQLADGPCFNIFETTKVEAPVIFCTAYSEYTTQAFKNNGIDYILKPFTKKDIELAFNKVEQLTNFFQRTSTPDLKLIEVIKTLSKEKEGKTNFLVFNQNSYFNLSTSEILYFTKSLNGVYAITVDGVKYPLKESLEEIQRLLSTHDFYRLNRQYLASFKAIKEVQHYFDRKLLVKLLVEVPEKLIVGREKATTFLNWLGNR